jgi:hypothetical protein
MRSVFVSAVCLLSLVGTTLDPARADSADSAHSIVPAEVATAPAWIGRRFDTGLVPMKHTHETFTLRRLGGQALLTIETRVAGSQLFELGPWKLQPAKTYLGKAEEKAKVVTLKLTNIANPSDTITLPCRLTTLAAAKADAVRRTSIPAAQQECGDRGRWHPTSTRRLPVLRCLPFDDKPLNLDDNSTWDSAPHLAFSPEPGIEWLYVNDDCLQGGGWRQVPADRSIVTQVR